MILLISAVIVFILFLNLAVFQANHVLEYVSDDYIDHRKSVGLSAIDTSWKFTMENWDNNVPIIIRGEKRSGIVLKNEKSDKTWSFLKKWERILFNDGPILLKAYHEHPEKTEGAYQSSKELIFSTQLKFWKNRLLMEEDVYKKYIDSLSFYELRITHFHEGDIFYGGKSDTSHSVYYVAKRYEFFTCGPIKLCGSTIGPDPLNSNKDTFMDFKKFSHWKISKYKADSLLKSWGLR